MQKHSAGKLHCALLATDIDRNRLNAPTRTTIDYRLRLPMASLLPRRDFGMSLGNYAKANRFLIRLKAAHDRDVVSA
jgi:hypothetical protein